MVALNTILWYGLFVLCLTCVLASKKKVDLKEMRKLIREYRRIKVELC